MTLDSFDKSLVNLIITQATPHQEPCKYCYYCGLEIVFSYTNPLALVCSLRLWQVERVPVPSRAPVPFSWSMTIQLPSVRHKSVLEVEF